SAHPSGTGACVKCGAATNTGQHGDGKPHRPECRIPSPRGRPGEPAVMRPRGARPPYRSSATRSSTPSGQDELCAKSRVRKVELPPTLPSESACQRSLRTNPKRCVDGYTASGETLLRSEGAGRRGGRLFQCQVSQPSRRCRRAAACTSSVQDLSACSSRPCCKPRM